MHRSLTDGFVHWMSCICLVHNHHIMLPERAWYLPGMQLSQSDSSSWPSDALYFPTPQSVQTVRPVAGEYLPVGQTLQSPSAVCANSALNFPAGQSIHIES